MLKPSKHDKNREKELKRMKDDPLAFGNFAGKPRPKDYEPNKGLKKASVDKAKDESKEDESGKQSSKGK